MSAAAATSEDLPPGEELPRKKWSGKRITIVAVAALLLIGGGVGGYFYFAKTKDHGEDNASKKEVHDTTVIFVDAPDILVNINNSQGKSRFLKLSVALQVKGEPAAAEIKKSMPKIVDNFQVYLRELRPEDLNGSAGMFLLKEELLRQINVELAPQRVDNVLFKELLLQ
jgi:flagellar protein FliL